MQKQKVMQVGGDNVTDMDWLADLSGLHLSCQAKLQDHFGQVNARQLALNHDASMQAWLKEHSDTDDKLPVKWVSSREWLEQLQCLRNPSTPSTTRHALKGYQS